MVTVNKQNNIQLINNFLNQSIMKKSLFAILAVAACFASCSEVIDSPVVDNPITFDNYVGKDAQTRAAVISNVETVYVNAYLHKKETSGGTGFKANFMSQQPVTKTTSEGKVSWTYTPVKYWPASDQAVDFVAWIDDARDGVPSNITISQTETTGGAEQYTDMMTFVVNSDIQKQTDLLVADPVLDKNNAGDNEAINLHFRHLLSRIGFEIVATGVPGVTDHTTIVTLDNITLSGSFANSGTVKMTASPVVITGEVDEEASYTLNGKHFGWTDDATTADFNEEDIIRGGTTSNLADSYLMLIPTNAVPANINVTYTVTTMADGEESGDPIVNSADFSLTGVQYQPGKAYKYIFYITMEGITFDVVVDDWDEQPSQGLNPEDGSWVTVTLADNTKIYYKGNLQVGSLIYVDGTGENEGKKVLSGAATYTLPAPDGRTITVDSDGKVTNIETPAAAE